MTCKGKGCYQFNCSEYHVDFCDLGYPQLDCRTYGDGSWSIIQLLNKATTPDQQKWNIIMNDIRNLEKNKMNFRSLIILVDPTKDYMWETEKKKSLDAISEEDKIDQESRYQAREVLRKFATSNSFSGFVEEHGWSKAMNPHFLMQQIQEHQPQVAREIHKANSIS